MVPLSRFERIILDCFVADLIIPELTFKNKEYFSEICYTRWAANELVDYIKAEFNKDLYRPIDDYIQCIDVFAAKMYSYHCLNTHNSLMFEVAEGLVLNVKDILVAMK